MSLHVDSADEAIVLWNKKWNDWHQRLQKMEDNMNEVKDHMVETKDTMKQILIAMNGTVEKPESGFAWRVKVIERWRTSLSTRSKAWTGVLVGIASGVVTACIIAIIMGTVMKKLLGGV